MRTHTLVLVAAAVMGVVVAGSVARAELKKGKISGRGMYTSTVLDSTKLANGTTVRHVYAKGFNTGKEPGNPFDGGCQDCLASEVVAADGSVVSSVVQCNGIDRDGDAWFVTTTDEPGVWVFAGGTGKFRGIEGGGTYKVENVWPDGRYTDTWEGVIK